MTTDNQTTTQTNDGTGDADPTTTDPEAQADTNTDQLSQGGGGGEDVTPWYQNLEDENLRASESLTKFDSPEKLAKSYLELEKANSQRVKIPEKDDTEGWEKLYDQLGRPKEPKDYDFSDIEHAEVLENEQNQKTSEQFKEIAHRYGLGQREAAGIMNEVMKMTVEQDQQRQQQLNQGIEELKKEYGNEYENRAALANDTLKKAVEKAGGDWDDLSQQLEATGLSNNPTLVKALSSIGRMMQQDRIWGAGGEPNDLGGAGVTEIKQQIDDLTANHASDILEGNPKGVQAQKKIDALLDKLGTLQSA